MSTRWVCTYCILTVGVSGSDLHTWPTIGDKAAQIAHIEAEHHIPVQRQNESVEQCKARFLREYPEAGDPATCKCPQCARTRAIEQMAR